MFFVDESAAAEEVDGSMFRGGHQPCAGVFGDSFFWPLLKRYDQGVVGKLFSDAHIADDTSQPGNQAGRLDLPDGFDSAMCVGSAHCYRSHHFQAFNATSAIWVVHGASVPCS